MCRLRLFNLLLFVCNNYTEFKIIDHFFDLLFLLFGPLSLFILFSLFASYAKVLIFALPTAFNVNCCCNSVVKRISSLQTYVLDF